MSRNIWVISDTHFQHENIIEYCRRPFNNANEMDEFMIERWNAVVNDSDIVYHLGDVYMGSKEGAQRILSRLSGRKRLIIGNHDTGKDDVLLNAFSKISAWRMFPEHNVLLSHVPIHQDSLRGLINVHGHTHERGSPPGPYVSACVEMNRYMPVNIEELGRAL